MKPYKNPRKYQWKCPFSECGKVFYSGGLGHLSAQACTHLKNVHDRLEDAGYVYKHGKAMSGYPSINGVRLVRCANCGIRWTDNPNGICRWCLTHVALPFGLGR